MVSLVSILIIKHIFNDTAMFYMAIKVQNFKWKIQPSTLGVTGLTIQT